MIIAAFEGVLQILNKKLIGNVEACGKVI